MDSPAAAEIQIHWRIKAWFPDLDFKVHILLRTYFNELIKQNKTINLIPTKSLINCDLLHFADSIEACKIVYKKANKNDILYDIGSGNGFPGLVYGIVYQDQKVVLVEMDDRRASFLKEVVTLLKLTNVSVEHRKIESFAEESMTQAICRGFGPLTKTLLTLRKIMKLNGSVFNLKSDDWSNEVLQIPTQLCSSWRPNLIGEYKLPITDSKLYVIEAIKI